MGLSQFLFGGAPTPDGQAEALQAAALSAGREMANLPDATPHRSGAHPRTILEAAVAQKILQGWLQNRHQTRYPLTLNLAHQTPEQAGLVVASVRYALHTVGAGEAEVRRAEAFIRSAGGALAWTGGAEPVPVDQVQQAQLGPHAYAACAGALDRRTLATRRFLHFLAARLGIPDEVARSLNRRYAG